MFGQGRATTELAPGFSMPVAASGQEATHNPRVGYDFPLRIAMSPGGQLNGPPAVTLATRTLRNSTPPWMIDFEDPEDRLSAHRFGWVLPVLASGASEEELAAFGHMATTWMATHPFAPESQGWDSYSISERIVHWVLLASALTSVGSRDCGTIRRDLVRGIREHATRLRWQLELRGESTNNHLINNGRALYCAGTFLGEPNLQGIGREILEYGARNMFTASGFLREGSSHYHILLSRSYLEVLWYAAKSGDTAFQERLRDRVHDMVDAAVFLMNGGLLHLIGDISPDFPPEFHAGVADVGLAILAPGARAPSRRGAGWHCLFDSGDGVMQPLKDIKLAQVKAFDDAGYYRVTCPPTTLTLYVNPLGYVPTWSHGHADLGGFVLDWRGRPLFVDCGRATYRETPLGRYGRSVRSHNAIAIDGHEPCVAHGHNGYVPAMVKDYCGPPPDVQVEERKDWTRIRAKYAGFRRLQENLVVTRTFDVVRNAVTITDEIEGDGLHLVETFFHVHPEVNMTSHDERGAEFEVGDTRVSLALIGTDPYRMEILCGYGGDQPAGWFAPRYGLVVPTVTVCYRQKVTLPVRNTYVITEANRV